MQSGLHDYNVQLRTKCGIYDLGVQMEVKKSILENTKQYKATNTTIMYQTLLPHLVLVIIKHIDIWIVVQCRAEQKYLTC